VTRRAVVLWLAPLALVLGAAIAPLATGERTLILRDVFNTHLGLRAFLAEALRSGELPLIDPLRAGGQVLVGNPNALPLYPDNVLLLVASTLWQLNAHFWLHGLVALAAMTALARARGVGWRGALVAGVVYALSGYLLSQMNLYNGVAVAALAPALAAALVASGEPARRGRALAALGVVWALELVAGDPLLAALALAAALVLALDARARIPWAAATAALGAGTLLAAPQWVELVRQLPTSFRGFWGSPASSQLGGSPGPRGVVDAVLPFFFGRPDLQQTWGDAFFGGDEPLYYSLAPGVLALALVAVALRRPERGDRAARLLLVVGVLLAYSGGAAGWLVAQLPGGTLFRFAVKFALFAALGGSLLAGRAFEGAREEPGVARALGRSMLAASALLVLLALVLLVPGNPGEPLFRALLGAGLDDANFAAFRRGWGITALLQVVVALAGLGLMRWLARGSDVAGGLFAALHAGSQLVFLAPMLPTDEAAPYREPPPLLSELPADAVLAQGSVFYLFGPEPYKGEEFPDSRLVHVARHAQTELFYFAGALAGRRYEFACSPEGLDSFLVHALTLAMRSMDDVQRLHVLAATGVDRLILARELSPEARAQVELVGSARSTHPIYLYRPLDALREVQLVSRVRFASSLSAAVTEVARGGLEPSTEALLAGAGEARVGPPGRAELVSNETERLVVDVDSPAGGALVVRRAWLPHWRAAIDGRRVPTVVANLTRLAVEMPAGRHQVELWIDRTPFRLACGASVLGLIALVALARWRAPDRRASDPA
jgi:hypothetical protein